MGRGPAGAGPVPRPVETEVVRERPVQVEEVERRPARDSRSSVADVLAIVYRVAQAVFLALALLVVLRIVFQFTPTNDSNSVVGHVNDYAQSAIGPLKDVFNPKNMDRKVLYNYGLAAVVYLILAFVVVKLPTGRRTRST